MLGFKVVDPVRVMGGNRDMVHHCSLMSSQLKKKHNAIAYHRIREVTAMGIVKLG